MDLLLDSPTLLIFMLVNLAMLISWFVLLFRVGAIKKHFVVDLTDKYMREAEIAELVGDKQEAAKNYLRAAWANYDYITNSLIAFKAKEKIKDGFYNDVIRCGGKWPEFFEVTSEETWECPECKHQNSYNTYECAKCEYNISN
jgi:hypothetical protein